MIRIIFFVLFALFLFACSKPSKETALDQINERMALNWMSNELSLQIGNKHKSFYSIGWRKSVAQDDMENVNKMQALVEVGLITVPGTPYRSLTFSRALLQFAHGPNRPHHSS